MSSSTILPAEEEAADADRFLAGEAAVPELAPGALAPHPTVYPLSERAYGRKSTEGSTMLAFDIPRQPHES
jgi:hypothetical protein